MTRAAKPVRCRQDRLAPLPPRKPNRKTPQVLTPHDVALPHPESAANEMRVPASINGVDLSSGRL